ncbi:MAG: YIP1 family protein [Deltaproteobacteria bacterium]|nr:YIP1 family protein [Deltaproteobacteria bacterium]
MKCAACGFEHPGTFGQPCPACGTVAQDPFQAAAPGTPNPWASPTAEPAPELHAEYTGIPWEDERSAAAMWETVKQVLLDASGTFARADPTVPLTNALLFALILGSAGAIINQLWQMAAMGAVLQFAPGTDGMEGLTGLGFSGIGGLITAPISVVVALFIQAAIAHVILMVLGGAEAGFEATFRVLAYTSGSVAPIYLVPGLGMLVGAIWSIVAGIIGLAAIHNTTGLKAAAALLLIPMLCLACVGIVAAIAIPTLMHY